MKPSSLVLAALMTLIAACSGGQPVTKAPSARSASKQPLSLYNEAAAPLEIIKLDELHFVGMDDGPVPDFKLRAVNGQMFDSDDLVGRRAFMIVFFATWCDVCDLKMEALHQALQVVRDVTVIGIAVDGEDTWERVGAFMREHRLELPLVKASNHPKFAMEYNPFDTVPLVVIVGRNGGLVDFQLGYTSADRERLIASVHLAKTIGPLAPPRSN